MTKQGEILVRVIGFCPDRWSYAFDGKTLMVKEEFDDMPDESWEMTLKILKQWGFEVNREGNTVSLKMETSQDKAIMSCLGELLTQAAILGFISAKTKLEVEGEITNHERQNLNPHRSRQVFCSSLRRL